VRACHPDHQFIEKTIITQGRFLNQIDLTEHRKVAVIGVAVVDRLFKNKGDAIGAWISVRGMMVRVVGVFDDEGGEGERSKIYIPISTAQMAFAAWACGDAALYVLDEPFAGVDAQSRERLWAWLLERKQAGAGILLAAHASDREALDALDARAFELGQNSMSDSTR
jgi:putative ABC transport system permease protein